MAFLEALAGGFSVTHAAKAAGVNRRRFYELKDSDEGFFEAWVDAWEAGTDVLRDESRRRAVEGWDEPMVSAGKVVATVRKFSDRLLELELKRRDPAYRERAGVNVAVGVGIDNRRQVQRGVSMVDVARELLKAGIDLPALAAESELESAAERAELVSIEETPVEAAEP